MKKFDFHDKTQRLMLMAFVFIFAVIGAYLLSTGRTAGTATLALAPPSQVVGLGSNFTVTIIEDSGTTPTNALQADLTYDQSKLQFVSMSTSTSPFTLIAQNTGGGGTTSLGVGSFTNLTGQQTVAVVTFTAIGTGTTPIAFAGSSGIAGQTSSGVSDILGSTTGASVTINDTTAPSVPGGLTTTNRTPTTTSFSWTASTDNVAVTGYKVYRNGTQIGTATGTTFSDTGLTPSTNYTYTVAAYDAANNTSAQSAPLAIATLADTTAPSVPNGLTVATRTINSITFNWTNSTDNVGVAGYKIYRNGTQISTATSATYTDNGLTPSTSYTYTVAAYDTAGNTSAQSAGGVFSTLADTSAPTVPANLTSPSQTPTSITLGWSASTDNVAVTGYRVYRNGTQIGTTPTPSFVDSGLAAGTSYNYAIAAYDAAGNVSAQSAAKPFSTIIKPGDTNNDGKVDFLDLSIMTTGWKSTTDLRADLNHDGVVNYLDLSILAANWGG